MHLKTRVTLGVVTIGAAVGAALVPTTSAFAAPGVTVTWGTQSLGLGLQDGDTATVTGTGFPASTQVFVSECSTNTGTAADCDQTPADGGVTAAQTDANGAFTASLVVRTETLGSAACGAASTCYAAATTNPTAPDATNTALASMKFDNLQVSPRSNLKAGQPLNLSGAGYNPSATVYVSECTSTDPTTALQKCDFNSVETYTTDANGKFTGVYHKAHTGVVGSDGSTCNPGGKCIIAGSDSIANPGNGHIGGAQVTFAQLKALSVTAKASKSHVAKGAKFAIKGKATSGSTGVKGLSVVLDKIKSGSPVKVASGKTGTGGAYAFTGLKQKKTTKYVVVITSQKGYKSATSKTVKVSTP